MDRLLAALFLSTLLISACATENAQLASDLQATANLAAEEAYTILDDDKIAGLEKSLPACIRDKMQTLLPSGHYVPSKNFRDALFPYFEPQTAPKTDEELSSLLTRPLVRKRIDNLGIRFLISTAGVTTQGEDEGLAIAGAGPTGGGCLGAKWATKESNIAVTIWDLKAAQKTGTLTAKSEGTFAVICIGLPIPIISATETAACGAAAERLANLLSGEKNGQGSTR